MTRTRKKFISKDPSSDINGSYIIQSFSFVKYIALEEWISSKMSPNVTSWISTYELHTNYLCWVKEHSQWTSDVTGPSTIFSKKLKQVLSAKEWGFSLIHQQGQRELVNMQWKKVAVVKAN